MYSYLQMTGIMCKTPSGRADYSLRSLEKFKLPSAIRRRNLL